MSTKLLHSLVKKMAHSHHLLGKLLLLPMLLSPALVQAEGEEGRPTSLVVITTDMQRATYVLTDNPQVAFDGNDVRISTAKTSIIYAFDKLARFEIEHGMMRPNGITETKDDGACFTVNDEGLISQGLQPGTLVQAFTLDGVCVGQSRVNEQGTCRLPLNSKSNTVLVIKAGAFTYKIHKK